MSSAARTSDSPVFEQPSSPKTQQTPAVGKQTQVIVISTAMLTFISFWRASAIVLCDMASTVYYNRGLLAAALHVQAIRNAIKANGGQKPTGEQVRNGFQAIKDFTLGGLVPPLDITATDHEGGGWVQVFQVKGGKFVKETEWMRGYPQVVASLVKVAE